jgi:hypothetical protein
VALALALPAVRGLRAAPAPAAPAPLLPTAGVLLTALRRARPRPTRSQQALLDLQQAVLDEQGHMLAGKTDEFLVEQGPSGATGRTAGRTRRQAPEVDGRTLVAGLKGRGKPGDWFEIRYKARRGTDWLATVNEGGAER